MSDEVSVGEEPEYEEKLDEKPRSILMAMIGQLKSGMDLSRVTLPTFILEPRSFLEKGADNMAHGKIIASYPPMPLDPAILRLSLPSHHIRSDQPVPATSLPPPRGGSFWSLAGTRIGRGITSHRSCVSPEPAHPSLPDPPPNPPLPPARQPSRSSNQRAATPQAAGNGRPARALPPGHQVVPFGLAPEAPGPTHPPSPPLPSTAKPLQLILTTPSASRA